MLRAHWCWKWFLNKKKLYFFFLPPLFCFSFVFITTKAFAARDISLQRDMLERTKNNENFFFIIVFNFPLLVLFIESKNILTLACLSIGWGRLLVCLVDLILSVWRLFGCQNHSEPKIVSLPIDAHHDHLRI